jgi:hypothetical protein
MRSIRQQATSSADFLSARQVHDVDARDVDATRTVLSELGWQR